jgi:hypothetical protein
MTGRAGASCTSGLFRFCLNAEGGENFFYFFAAAFWAFQFKGFRSDSNEFIKFFFTTAALIRVNRHFALLNSGLTLFCVFIIVANSNICQYKTA